MRRRRHCRAPPPPCCSPLVGRHQLYAGARPDHCHAAGPSGIGRAVAAGTRPLTVPGPSLSRLMSEPVIETLHFENARLAQQLLNNDPANLRNIESRLRVKLTTREGWIRLEGDAAAVERGKQFFETLEGAFKAGHSV